MLAVWSRGNRDVKNYNCIFILSGEFSASSPILKIAAENLYRIHVNGKFAAFGPSRSCHGVTEYDEIPLAGYLKSGHAVIAVEITAYNISCIGFANDKPFFAAEVSENGKVRYNSADFRCYELTDRERVVPKYSWQRHFLECYRMTSDRRDLYLGKTESFPEIETETAETGRILPRSVSYPVYGSVWADILCEVGSISFNMNAPVYKNRFLYNIGEDGYAYESISKSVISQVEKFVYRTETALPVVPNYAIYDLGRNFAGFIKMDVTVKEKAEIILLFDEVLNEEGKINPLRMNMANMIRFELSPGEFKLESVEPYEMKYIKVIILEGKAEINRIGIRKYENPDAERLEFSCSDKDMEFLIEAARHTFEHNAVDIPTDCPSRERAGWLCDSYYIGKAERIFTGENKTERHFLFNYANCPEFDYFPEGMIPMCYPGEFKIDKKYIANWSLWYILELYDYFLRTGDEKMCEISHRKVEGLLKYFEKYENSDGLIEDVDSWVFVEWSRANDFTKGVNYPSNMLYGKAIEAAGKLLSRPELDGKAAEIRRKIREQALGADGFYRDNALRENGVLKVTENISETCQYYAFFFGIATSGTDEKLFNVLKNEFGAARNPNTMYPNVFKSNAFIGNLMRVDYFSGNGYAADALRQVKDYYLYQAKETGTLWEYDEPKKSCCHGFAAYIVRIILRGICGFDRSERETVYIMKDFNPADSYAKIPLSDCDYLEIAIMHGKRSVTVPEKYKIIEI